RIVFGSELPAAGVIGVAARLGRKRLQQEQALARVAGHDQARNDLEVLPRLLLGPELRAFRKLLQPEGVVAALRVAHVAADVVGPLLEEDGLDARLEKSVVERLRGS